MEESGSEELPSNLGERIYTDVPQQSEDPCTITVTLDSQTIDAATQLTATAHELFPACDGSTQTPINWMWKGTQTNPVVRPRGKFFGLRIGGARGGYEGVNTPPTFEILLNFTLDYFAKKISGYTSNPPQVAKFCTFTPHYFCLAPPLVARPSSQNVLVD